MRFDVEFPEAGKRKNIVDTRLRGPGTLKLIPQGVKLRGFTTRKKRKQFGVLVTCTLVAVAFLGLYLTAWQEMPIWLVLGGALGPMGWAFINLRYRRFVDGDRVAELFSWTEIDHAELDSKNAKQITLAVKKRKHRPAGNVLVRPRKGPNPLLAALAERKVKVVGDKGKGKENAKAKTAK